MPSFVSSFLFRYAEATLSAASQVFGFSRSRPAVSHYPNAQSVLEVSKPVSLTRENFYFVVKAFGDVVIAGEAPHGGDFFSPGIKRIAERH